MTRATVASSPTEGCAIQPSFSSKFASDLISFAAEHGADRDALTRLTHLPPSARDREDVRIPCTTMAAVWCEAISQTGNAHLAMEMAAGEGFGANRTTSLIMESSSTVLEAFQLAARYSVLIADVMTVRLGEEDDDIFIAFTPTPIWAEQPVEVQLDCIGITYVSAVGSLKRLMGTDQPPSLLSVALPAPVDTQRWTTLLGRDVEFGARRHAIGFPASIKAATVPTRDPGLKQAIRRYADEVREGFGSNAPIVNQVTGLVIDNITPSPPSVDYIARELGMSSRALQRLLRSEGHTYRSLVERVRMELSERHLREATTSIDEVARLVGYADTSSFVRAFKRHTGLPPRQFTRGRG